MLIKVRPQYHPVALMMLWQKMMSMTLYPVSNTTPATSLNTLNN